MSCSESLKCRSKKQTRIREKKIAFQSSEWHKMASLLFIFSEVVWLPVDDVESGNVESFFFWESFFWRFNEKFDWLRCFLRLLCSHQKMLKLWWEPPKFREEKSSLFKDLFREAIVTKLEEKFFFKFCRNIEIRRNLESWEKFLSKRWFFYVGLNLFLWLYSRLQKPWDIWYFLTKEQSRFISISSPNQANFFPRKSH